MTDLFHQFAVLGGHSISKGTLLWIADWQDSPSDKGRDYLLASDAGMNIAVLNFGSPHTTTTFNSYILQSPDGRYELYRPWQWNHYCFSWSSGGRSKIVLVMTD